MTKTYTFHTDPGHGWLEVPYEDLVMYCDVLSLSTYSYAAQDGRTFYLEEDCDAPLFMKGLEKNGVEISVEEQHTNEDHWIRRLDGFTFS